MKIFKTRCVTSLTDYLDWLNFYKIQPEQIVDCWTECDGNGNYQRWIVYWTENED